jgi:hypothetical protein
MYLKYNIQYLIQNIIIHHSYQLIWQTVLLVVANKFFSTFSFHSPEV